MPDQREYQTDRSTLRHQNTIPARVFADLLPQFVWTADAEGSAIFFNAAWSGFTGLSLTESTSITSWPR